MHVHLLADEASPARVCSPGARSSFLKKRCTTTPDNVISGLINYVDSDGDAKTLSMAEFTKMMSAEFLS